MSEARTSSPFIGEIEPITESDDELARILEDADLQPLLPALAYATGDLTLLRDDLRLDPVLMAFPGGGLTTEQQQEIRAVALEALKQFRDGGCRPAPPPSEADTIRIMEYATGGAEMTDYAGLLEEELGHRGEDRRAPRWHKDQVAPDAEFDVLVVGAGMSGILAGHRLQQAGIRFTIVEKNPDVGGTWFENSYPGCRVDNPNHNFSYSFAQRHDWPFHFSTQPVLHRYFSDCADAFDVRRHVRFSTEVVSAMWSEGDQRWTVVVRDGAGEHELRVNAVVSAVGQLNRPSYPDIPGRDSFAGPAFHSARWDHGADLRGKRVAVIGTGASAMQFIPEIAAEAGELVVFQRTPAWLIQTADYHEPVSPNLRWLYDHVPAYSEWTRFCIFWRMGDGALAGVRVDPEWPQGEAVSPMNAMLRMVLHQYLTEQFADRPDLLEVVVPAYPPGAKRVIRDNGVWADALKRSNVRLVTEAISEITAAGVQTTDGALHEADVLVFGTGFQASKFLTPMKVTGRDGVDLHEHWQGDARAFLGVNVPGFPNLFCLYGPNTNIVINGSIIYFSECGTRYILTLLEWLLRGGHRAIDVRKDVHDEFTERVDAENRMMAWGASDVNSWYKNEHGHVAQNWPFTLLEYWRRTTFPNVDDYDFS